MRGEILISFQLIPIEEVLKVCLLAYSPLRTYVPNAQCPMPNAQRQCSIPIAQCPIAQYPMPNAQCPMP